MKPVSVLPSTRSAPPTFRTRLLLLGFALATTLTGPSAPAQGLAPTELAPGAVSGLAKFDLDFPGGTPAELVAAINRAIGQPINVIIPIEHAKVRLPALKMSRVDVRQLFAALEAASAKVIVNDMGGYEQTILRFLTKDQFPAASSIWYFQVEGQPAPPKVSHFFPLAPYLRNGLTVDDITTAIRTGWEMRGNSDLPSLKFHAETQLLIAVGRQDQLQMIHQALNALGPTIEARDAAIPPPASPPEPAPAPTPAPPADSAAAPKPAPRS